MSMLIKKDGRIIRINPRNKNQLEYSRDDGRNWNNLANRSDFEFLGLLDNGREILAQASNGFWYSTDDGNNWNKRS